VQASAQAANMPPPQGVAGRSSLAPSSGTGPVPQQPSSGGGSTVAISVDDSGSGSYDHFVTDGKKQQKRAANRRSAQLSRKRKKAFMEELKEENDVLRRKELILRSIPDLVVVFDSTGKLWFVSQSVKRFLKYTAEELEGTSIWERLCVDSVRLLKAAFMDSLAARQPDSDSAPLGSGFWQLRLVDKDGTKKVVTVNGVVHFAGDRPECVCSIRPGEDVTSSDDTDSDSSKGSNSKRAKTEDCKLATTAADGEDGRHRSLIRVRPQQSVVSSSSGSDSSNNGNGSSSGGGGSGGMNGGGHRIKAKRSMVSSRSASNHRAAAEGIRSSRGDADDSETGSGSGSSDE